MGKGKILVFLRVSTEVQELDEQKKEMKDFCISMGYTDILFIEGKGASAIKINDEYIEMYEEVKSHIDNKDISAVAVWAVNRLARDEEWFVKFKKMFIENKVQFLVKNPTLALLNPDGSVNAGSELALSLFSTMAQQEMKERKEKFKRTKKTFAAQGKYVGGHSLKYGYVPDENNYLVENKEESAIIRLVYELYSTGNYSAESLAKELNSRGYSRYGKPFDRRFVTMIIQSKQYTGLPSEKWNDRVYPPIISVELFEKCRKIAEGNKIVLRQGKKLVLCSKLVKCPECGYTFTSKGKYFRCNSVTENRCTNSITLRESVVNEIVWRVAFMEHMEYLIEMSENNTQAYKERLEIIEQKLNTLNGIIAESDKKKKRVIDTYLEGYIDLKERDLRLKKIQDDTLSQHKELKGLEEEKSAILGLLDNVNKEKDEWLYYDTLDTIGNSVKTDEDRYRIIHQHILKILPTRVHYGEKGRRTKGLNGMAIEIHTVKGNIKKFIYLPKAQSADNLLTYDNDKGIWLGEKINIG